MLNRKHILYILSAIISGSILLFIYFNRDKLIKIVIPFFMAIIIAYLLQPLVQKMEKKKIPRMVGILLLYFLFSSAAASIIIFIIPELVNNTKELMTTIPDISSRYQKYFNSLLNTINSSNWSEEFKTAISGEIQSSTLFAQSLIMDTLRKSLGIFLQSLTVMLDLALAMIIAYYFIKDGEKFREGLCSLTPRKWRNGLIGTGREINVILANFIQGQLLTALIVGILETICLFIIQIKYPLVLGLVGGLANIIPYFGPIIGAIPAVAVALIQSPAKAGWAILVFIIIQQIDNAFISPKIIEGKLGLHPITTIVAVLAGGEFFGILGMLLAVPIFAMLKVIFKRTVESIV